MGKTDVRHLTPEQTARHALELELRQLDNLPDIAKALTNLFATPAVGRIMGKAGEVAVEWVKKRFGGKYQ